MKSFRLIVSTPGGNVFDNDIAVLSLRGTEGSLAVMANHVPFITATKEGEIKIVQEDESEILAYASDGILTVAKENVTLLCGSFDIKK